jgi:hypothetical protein
MAAMAARGRIHDGPISKFVHNRLDYLCAKFGAFIKKCTIGLNIQGKQPRHLTKAAKRAELYCQCSVLLCNSVHVLPVISGHAALLQMAQKLCFNPH